MNPWRYDSDIDYYESLAINPEDQEYDGEDDSFDPRECDKAALAYELTYLRLDSRY